MAICGEMTPSRTSLASQARNACNEMAEKLGIAVSKKTTAAILHVESLHLSRSKGCLQSSFNNILNMEPTENHNKHYKHRLRISGMMSSQPRYNISLDRHSQWDSSLLHFFQQVLEVLTNVKVKSCDVTRSELTDPAWKVSKNRTTSESGFR